MRHFAFVKIEFENLLKIYVNLINYGLGLIKRSERGYSACKTRRTM